MSRRFLDSSKAVAALVLIAALAGLAIPGRAAALTVYAATSLSRVLPQIDRSPRYAFGGSNVLQLQIERGAPADLFLSASPQEAQALFRRGRCERPITFTTNTLVLIARQGDPKRIRTVYGLRRGGLRLSVGNAAVPVGDYTRRLLRRLKLSGVLRSNRVSEASNVGQVLSQVAFGGADAGFVYRSDALPQLQRVDLLAIPPAAQPAISYQGCVVRRSGADRPGARRLLASLHGTRARTLLRRAGFGPAPRR